MFFRWSLISVYWELPDGYWQHTSKRREREMNGERDGLKESITVAQYQLNSFMWDKFYVNLSQLHSLSTCVNKNHTQCTITSLHTSKISRVIVLMNSLSSSFTAVRDRAMLTNVVSRNTASDV